MIKKSEFLIIGSGVAGMSYALKVANAGKGKDEPVSFYGL